VTGYRGRARDNGPVTRILIPAVACATLLLGACSADEPEDETTSTPAAGSSAAESAEPVSDEPFGPGCAALPADGEGSIAGMADDPLFVAATNNPELATFVQAVTTANLGDALNGTANITVLVPSNAAFAAVPPESLQGLLADSALLTSTLVHHVVPGRLGPEELAGTHTTLNNGRLTVEGSGEQFTIPAEGTSVQQADATVVCGNIQTANATIYIVDQVLRPAE
jgi:uncharacterized surface protein with fasciclin (FAS1) repeats